MLNKKQMYLILVALCFLVYANSLNNAFVSDDIDAIVKNQFISKPLYFWLLPSDLLNSIIYPIAQEKPFLYRLANIILHCIATIMVFYFLRLFFKSEASFLASSLFAIHPIHTEAVAWVAGRPYILMVIFILGTYFLYNRAVNSEERGSKFRPLLYLTCLAICSYYIAKNFSFYFLFPLFLVLSDFSFGRCRKNWQWWVPFFVVLLFRMFLAKGIIAGRVASVIREAGSKGSSWTNPIYNAAYSIFANLSLIIWPAKLTLYHEPPVITRFLLNCELITLALLVLALPFIFKKARGLFFAIALYVIFLTPTYSPVMISWLVAERYLYFPSVAFIMLTAFCYEKYVGPVRSKASEATARTSNGIGRSEKVRRQRALVLFIFIIAAYAVRTVARNEDWKTPERFWRQTVLVSNLSPRAYNNMGDVYCQEGNTDGAIKDFKRAIELKRDYADAYYNLANVYHRTGNIQEAIKNYQLAISYKPELFEANFNLGIIYLNNTDQTKLAVQYLKKAVELRPLDATALTALSFALNKQAGK